MAGGSPEQARDAMGSTSDGAKVTTELPQQMLVKTAEISLTVDDITKATESVRAIAQRSGGIITNESLSQEQGREPVTSSLTLRVPADRLDKALDELSALGTVHRRASNTEDVTTQYVDVESRVATLRRSVERLRALIDKATDVKDIAAIEGELSQRESDLESMEAQLTALKGSIAQSTIFVTMSTQAEAFQDDSGGFIGGLKAGWRALLVALGFLLTAAGALLPFALVAAIVIAPFALWTRRHLARKRASSLATPDAAPPAPSDAAETVTSQDETPAASSSDEDSASSDPAGNA